MENNNNLGLVILGVAIFASVLILAGTFVKFGARAAAIEKGMTPQQYSSWMDAVN